MDPSPVVPILGKAGLFAVLTRPVADRLRDGYMKLYFRNGTVFVETITRSRRPLLELDPGARLVFLAVDQNGKILAET